MSCDEIRYIFESKNDKETVLLTALLKASDRDYFLYQILPTLRPLSDEEYMHGPACILCTMARYSYILYKQDVYWCIEWDPGLIVTRFAPNSTMAWTALRSPIPNFGGREPNEDDIKHYDENAENHQYNLVFEAWDAQYGGDVKRRRFFKRASKETVETYKAALEHVQTLEERLEARYSERGRFDQWSDKCKRNLTQWAGEGIRVSW